MCRNLHHYWSWKSCRLEARTNLSRIERALSHHQRWSTFYRSRRSGGGPIPAYEDQTHERRAVSGLVGRIGLQKRHQTRASLELGSGGRSSFLQRSWSLSSKGKLLGLLKYAIWSSIANLLPDLPHPIIFIMACLNIDISAHATLHSHCRIFHFSAAEN